MADLHRRWRSANDDVLATITPLLPDASNGEPGEEIADGPTRLSIVSASFHDYDSTGPTLSMHAQTVNAPPGAGRRLTGATAGVKAIPSSALAGYAAVLELSEEQQIVLDSIHDDYRAAFAARVDPLAEDLTDERRDMWTVGDDEEITVPASATVERSYAIERRIAEEARGVDDAFFDDVRIALTDEPLEPRLERLRLARERARCRVGFEPDGTNFTIMGGRMRSMGRAGNVARNEAAVRIDALCDELTVDDATRAAIEPVLASYVAAAVGQARIRHDASLQMRSAVERTIVESWTDDNRMVTIGTDSPYTRANTAVGSSGATARDALIELNRTTRDELRAVLPAEAAESLRRAYDRDVYPQIYRDPRSAERLIGLALALEDLTPEQRARIAEIATEYRHAYDDLSARMVEFENLSSSRRMTWGGAGVDPEEMQKRMTAMREQQRLSRQVRFDRQDLSDRTRNQIELLLDEAQRRRLGEEQKKKPGARP
jgi:hypothetical protein